MIRTLAVPLFLAFYTSYLPGSVVGKLNPVRAEKPAPTYVGASTVAIYPPPDVTVDTALFPDESHIGYPGPTPSKPPLPRQRYSKMLLTSWTDSSLFFYSWRRILRCCYGTCIPLQERYHSFDSAWNPWQAGSYS